MSTVGRMVIVGGGAAGAAAVAELRARGFAGAVTLVCGEDAVPYERPPLSKEFLLGPAARTAAGAVTGSETGPADGSSPFYPAGWYDDHDIDVRRGTRAVGLDPRAATVTLSDGGTVGYDRLLLATGARPRVLPGLDGDRVCYLRTVGDAVRLRDRLAAAGHVVILGGGFIGCEVAAAAVRRGKRVTILEALPGLLYRVLGPELGGVVAGIHAAEGVDVRTGVTVTGIWHEADGLTVLTDAGSLRCDLLVAGAGTVPSTELAERAGLEAASGIPVDEYCATPVPGVYAAGDVAAQRVPGHARPVRVEHHDSALRQGRAAARNMLGLGEPFTDVHWFWSDQYEHTIQSAGVPDGVFGEGAFGNGAGHDGGSRQRAGGGYVLRGSLSDRRFAAFWLDGDRIRAVVALNRPHDVLAARRLIGAGQPV
ncbi:MAG TPA: FAD-dependent oxidoreductase, partial [Trebonia sp.]|nr:FAD-dependent oxidoreductase [Trebonia sp.]